MSSMRSMRVETAKHKVAFGDDEMPIKSKKALLSTDVRLNEAIDNTDFLALKEILECKDEKVPETCLQAALLKAAEEGKKQIVQLLLTNGVCVKGRSETGSLALIAAAKHGYLDIVKLLIKKGAPVNGKDSSGKTALMAAVEKSCCSALITFLLEGCKADVNLQDDEGKTALMLAVEQWDYETVQILFLGNDEIKDYNCDEDIKDKEGHTALDLARMNGSDELLNVLKESRKKLCSPLSIAAGWNNLDLVKRLLDIHPSCVDNLDFGEEPLTSAMHGLDGNQETWDGKIHCSFELMDFLLQLGVNVNSCHLCGHTPLMFAAAAGSERAVRMLLSHKAYLDDVSYEMTGHHFLKSRTALMMAAQLGWVSIVELLIQAGANLKMKDGDQEDALGLAILGGHKTCVQALLKHWTPLSHYYIEIMAEQKVLDVLTEVKDRWENLFENAHMLQEVLCKAVQTRCYELVKALIIFGAEVDFDIEDEYHLRPLHSALDDFDMLCLLVEYGADIELGPTESDCTPLMMAASAGNKTHVQNLLRCDADLEAEFFGSTALTIGCAKENVEIITVLLENGMDVDHITGSRTPLWHSLDAGKYRSVETLIRHGANVNFADCNGVTVLMKAVKQNPPIFSKLILESGAAINTQDNRGNTALFHALEKYEGSVDMEEKVSLLLRRGADVNHTNLAMKTPLMVATELKSDFKNVLKTLLDSQSDVNAQDVEGDTALHYAVSSFDEAKLEMLSSKGADMNLANHESRTPLLAAFKNLNEEAVRGFLRRGAIVNENSSQGVRQVWINDLNGCLRKANKRSYSNKSFYSFIACFGAMLQCSCTLQGVNSPDLDEFSVTCIDENEFGLLIALVTWGVGPNTVPLSCVPTTIDISPILDAASVCNSRVSPMCVAILARQPKIVAMFALAKFYHKGDVEMLQQPFVREFTQFMDGWINPDLFSIDDLRPDKWSLQTWSKLAVLRAVGYGSGREQRVRALPIPHELQDEFLYKQIP
ncbi:ankyrin repeat protein [Elysia marginata]|uniref:Ankyrin repeat protein n=1 Tax=Elysia marginata TaxID=1093978 RepID=A0AAV4HM79_9GAST|nr:ankyrin repeat protein [Elysia marginata]